ncbi:hypothetical protein QAD02_018233 [Eretmocerus hayati]|uniref:Uncharacterized protein n=1 Tax=Eretmocerus hayati TaxID=131215 RepID=A0ACC2PHD2_9HYME|nr:hypothetical protein QAD02_018233 [Eretmocerus hayati]
MMRCSSTFVLYFLLIFIFDSRSLFACEDEACSTQIRPRCPLENPPGVFPQCPRKISSTDAYPYFAIIKYVTHSGLKFNTVGVIISDQYVLTESTIFMNFGCEEYGHICNFTVITGANAQGENGSEHRADRIKIGNHKEITLLKLHERIKFGPRAQPVEMATRKPNVEERVGYYSWVEDGHPRRPIGILSDNITLISDSKCRKLVSHSSDSRVIFQIYPSILCTYPFKDLCPSHELSMLINNEKELVGIGRKVYENSHSSHALMNIYHDISQYRTTIGNHMEIPE